MRDEQRHRYFRPLLALAIAGLVAALTPASLPSVALAGPPMSTAATGVASSFSDLRGDEPYAAAARAVADKAVMLTHHDGSFDPGGKVTRGEMAYSLASVIGLAESPNQQFSDIQPYDWFAGSVGALVENKLVQGTSRTTFSPERAVTRQEAATLVMRAVAFARPDDPAVAAALKLTREQALTWLGGFRDRLLIDPVATVVVAAAYRLGILDCPPDGWFFPAGSLSRGEMVMMLHRAFLRPIVARNAFPLELGGVAEYASLATGSKGTLVSWLETRLTSLHYPCGPVDGVYDYRTRDAVMAFQKVEGLARTGRVTAQVWEALGVAQAPAPGRPGTGIRCEVDLTRQVLFLVSDNKVTEAIHVSTGRRGTRTGHFSIGAKYEGWVECVTLDGKMYYPSYVVSRTAIHGYKEVPPYPASHGCVRVPVWTAEQLYYELPSGTAVDIFY